MLHLDPKDAALDGPAGNRFPNSLQAWGADYSERARATAAKVRTIHTLGPEGTNLGAASNEWFRRNAIDGQVLLYRTVEDALRDMPQGSAHAVMTCAVYPELHSVVFGNLRTLSFIDCFVWPTHPMILASRPGVDIATVATHPAPQSLVPEGFQRHLVTSNSQAAADCAAGSFDACITTMEAARARGLVVVQDFGPVPMVYTLHGRPPSN